VPDLVTHMALGIFLRRPYESLRPSADDAAGRTMFYLGILLPDLLTRPWYILFPSIHDWVFALHTPAGMLAVSGLLASRFEKSFRSTAFRFLIAGGLLHFLLDGFQKQVSVNHFWLFPFSYANCGIGLFWPGDAVALAPLWAGLAILLEIGLRLGRQHGPMETRPPEKGDG
jgi:hypothetical protein